ncbi:MAG: type II secretion system ATPase GspE [Desulfobulbaceae bacterium]|nr:type II secretion system ATPase GspE [Desulfobulbaceae bacterium]
MKRLGEILISDLGINPEVIEQALAHQRVKGGRLGDILVHQKKISEEDLLKARGILNGLAVIRELPVELDPFFTDRVDIHFLKKFKMVPIATREDCFVAIADPYNFQQLDDLLNLLNWQGIKVVLSPQEEIFTAINTSYELGRRSADQVMQDIDETDPESLLSEIEETSDLLDDTSDAPVIKLVNLMLSNAVREGVSDIHIEPYKDRVKIRKRVDGILYDMYAPPKHVQAKLISRIKIMAKLNIAEKRLPQDGRIEIRLAEKNVDIRVSTLPTAFGERVVLRLLDKSNVLLSLTDLGMASKDLETFHRLIKAPHGIVLVTGPTGSGKTTTLYSALSILNSPDINIITVEDPIEYQINGISQVQVNPKIDLTFANGLRTIVRQDPDVILVGEIRDMETAEIAIQAALTGHLVFSTLHTNDAASAVTRIIDMGVEPFLVSSAVNAILAQRLVRKICPECKEAYTPDAQLLIRAGASPAKFSGRQLYRGTGCPSCLNTGYQGRIGIYELMVLTDQLKHLILTTSDSNQINKEARTSPTHPMQTLRQDGLRKVFNGLTTLEEVVRVT